MCFCLSCLLEKPAVFLSTLEVMRRQVCFAVKQTDLPCCVDPDNANVAEENTLLVLLVLARAASDPLMGLVGEVHRLDNLLILFCHGAQD